MPPSRNCVLNEFVRLDAKVELKTFSHVIRRVSHPAVNQFCTNEVSCSEKGKIKWIIVFIRTRRIVSRDCV